MQVNYGTSAREEAVDVVLTVAYNEESVWLVPPCLH